MIALDRWNALPPADAIRELMACCGSQRWARGVVDRRPFGSLDELRAAADDIWWQLEEDDWLEAFGHHPRIGERPSAAPASVRSSAWSEQEQSRAATAATDVQDRLRKGNAAYEQRFGHIYIVCAADRTAEDLLSALEQRLGNDPRTELRTSAEEQRKITHLRLERLFGS
jgi:OHCU decarboxylase